MQRINQSINECAWRERDRKVLIGYGAGRGALADERDSACPILEYSTARVQFPNGKSIENEGKRGGREQGREPKAPSPPLPKFFPHEKKKTISSLPGGCSSRLVSPGTVSYLACLLTANLSGGLESARGDPGTLDFPLTFLFDPVLYREVLL